MNMKGSGYREKAQMLIDIRSFIEEVKKHTSTAQPVKFAFSTYGEKYKFNSKYFRDALVHLGIIKVEQRDNVIFTQWHYGVKPLTDELIQDVHKQYNKPVNKNKQASRKGLNVKDTGEVKAEVKGEVKAEAKPVKTKNDELKEIKGTIFGYKQLKYMVHKAFYGKRTIRIDGRFSVPGVRLIRFDVSGSELSCTFYTETFMDSDLTVDTQTLSFHFIVTNTVLAFDDDVENNIVNIQTVPVKDPYNLKE